MTKVGILVGSLRKESFSKKIAENVVSLFPAGYETEFIQIGNLPLYNQDYDDENNIPEEYAAFRSKVQGMDAFLMVTPEYNRSVPAVLKNALDVGSRPKIQQCLEWQTSSYYKPVPGELGRIWRQSSFASILDLS